MAEYRPVHDIGDYVWTRTAAVSENKVADLASKRRTADGSTVHALQKWRRDAALARPEV